MATSPIDLSAGLVPKSGPPKNQGIDLSAGFVKMPPATPEPSAVPSGSDWLHAAGLPGSMAEADLTPKQALQVGAMNILHAADPTYLLRSFAVPMVKEGSRAVKGIWEHGGIPSGMDAVHAASAVNPFAAPVVNRMSELREQGKEGEATATGVLGAGTLAAGEVLPKVAPAAAVFKKPFAAVADTLNPDLVGILSPRAAHVLRTIGKVAEALPDKATAETHPATVAAVKNAFDAIKSEVPSARMIDVPSYAPRPSQPAPVNLLDQAPTTGGGLRGSQGEFPIVAPESGLNGNLSDLASKPNTEGLYGKYSGKSNLPANKRQLAIPTGSTAPGQKPAVPTLTPKANPTAEDLKFQDQHMAEIIEASIVQMRKAAGR